MAQKMKANIPRIVEAVLFLVNEASRQTAPLTQYDIVKSLFLADTKHLNDYGRPVTFDSYSALEHGPVPKFTYDLLKQQPGPVAACGGHLPWTRRPAPGQGANCYYYENPERDADEDILAPSDLEALREAFHTVRQLGFSGVRRLTHEHPAYQDAWRDDPACRSFPMDYSKLFDKPNPHRAEELAFLSAHI